MSILWIHHVHGVRAGDGTAELTIIASKGLFYFREAHITLLVLIDQKSFPLHVRKSFTQYKMNLIYILLHHCHVTKHLSFI